MKTQRKKEWFDDELFWRELYPFIFSDKRFADAEDEIAAMLELTNPNGETILDLCCGPGRFSIALAEQGFAVTGVDKTKFLLDRARAKARTAKSFKFHHTIYSGQELKVRLELVGFRDVKLYGDLSGDAYGPNAQRLIAVGEKTTP